MTIGITAMLGTILVSWILSVFLGIYIAITEC